MEIHPVSDITVVQSSSLSYKSRSHTPQAAQFQFLKELRHETTGNLTPAYCWRNDDERQPGACSADRQTIVEADK